jgi:hypothetical protein
MTPATSDLGELISSARAAADRVEDSFGTPRWENQKEVNACLLSAIETLARNVEGPPEDAKQNTIEHELTLQFIEQLRGLASSVESLGLWTDVVIGLRKMADGLERARK